MSAIRSAEPGEAPRIFPEYLREPHDLEVLLEGVRLSREILHAAPFRPYLGVEVFPGEDCTTAVTLEQVVRRKAETIYHPVGTCRMGSDAEAVVDGALRVRGVGSLRVIDASVMPRLIGGNTNAPTIMIAELAAADIIGDARAVP